MDSSKKPLWTNQLYKKKIFKSILEQILNSKTFQSIAPEKLHDLEDCLHNDLGAYKPTRLLRQLFLR